MDNETFQVYCKLIRLAMTSKTITYRELAQDIGLPTQGLRMAQRLGQILDHINKYEHAHGRPLITALVVHAGNRIPGEGFFKSARELGKSIDAEIKTDVKFWSKELESIKRSWA